MKQGMSPRDAIVEALGHISEYYTYTGAMIAVNINGEYGRCPSRYTYMYQSTVLTQYGTQSGRCYQLKYMHDFDVF